MRYTTISFPDLGIQLNPPRGIPIGNFTVYFYAIAIAIGVMLAVTYAIRRCKEFGIHQDALLDGVLWILPVAILCARAYYCIFSWDSYKDDLLSLLDIRSGGLAIYGGVIGAALCLILHCRIKKIGLFAMLDMTALGLLIGQSIGRWGNFFNREAFGEATEIFLRMGLYNTLTGEFEYYHPTFFYESLWNAVGFVLLHFLSKKRKYDGQIALGYVAWYGFGRAFIEGLRTDSLYIGAFRVSQLLAAVSCAAAVGVLIWQAFRKHEKDALFVNKLAMQQEKNSEVENNE